jgi:hypothetical protein
MLEIQVICEKADRTDIPTIDKKKYLVPSVGVLLPCTVRDECLIVVYFTGSNCWSIRLCHPEAHQACTRESHIHLCRRGSSADRCPYECHIRGAQVRPLH